MRIFASLNLNIGLGLCCTCRIKVVLECGVVMGTELSPAEIVLRRSAGSFVLTCLFPTAIGAMRWDRIKRRLGQEKASVTDATGIGCHLPLGMKWWDMMTAISGPPWQVEERRKGTTVIRLGSLAVWVSTLVLGSVKSPFWSCSYWWLTGGRTEPPEGIWRKKHTNCHDLPVAGGCSRCNRWNGRVRAGSLQPVNTQAKTFAPCSCTRHSAKIKLEQW